MTRALHLGIETNLYGEWETVPVCGYNFHRTKKLTDDPAQVTCRTCLTLSGYDAAPVDQLTACEPNPVRWAA